jgi:hypothetical protein
MRRVMDGAVARRDGVAEVGQPLWDLAGQGSAPEKQHQKRHLALVP